SDQFANHVGHGPLLERGQPLQSLLELRGQPYGHLNVGRPGHGNAKVNTTATARPAMIAAFRSERRRATPVWRFALFQCMPAMHKTMKRNRTTQAVVTMAPKVIMQHLP